MGQTSSDKKPVPLKGRNLFRLLAFSLLAALLALPLAPGVVRADDGIDKDNKQAENLAIALCKRGRWNRKYGSHDECLEAERRSKEASNTARRLDQMTSEFGDIYKSFVQIPRAEGFIVAAEDCDDTRNIRQIMESRIRQLQDIHRRMSEGINSLKNWVLEKTLEKGIKGRHTLEFAESLRGVHEDLESRRNVLKKVGSLIKDIQMTEVQDKCSKPKGDKPTWTAGDIETASEDLPPGAIGPWVWPSGEPETVELTPPGGDAGPGGCQDERREVKRVALRYSIGGTEGDAPAGGTCGVCKEGFKPVPGAGGQIQCLSPGEIEESFQPSCQGASQASYNPDTGQVRCVAVGQGGSPGDALVRDAITTGIGIGIGSILSRSRRRRRPRHPQPSGPSGGGHTSGGGCPGC